MLNHLVFLDIHSYKDVYMESPLPTFRQILISKHRKITFRRRVNKLVFLCSQWCADKILYLLLVAWDFLRDTYSNLNLDNFLSLSSAT